jgi:CRISPR-associated endoribonuclease Cas6
MHKPQSFRPDHPHLPLARYELHFRALEAFSLEEDPRGLWHGVFGHALRAFCCVTGQPECLGCPLLHRCQYSYLFTAPRPPGAEMMRRYHHIPVPHIFQLGVGHPRVVDTGDAISISLVLVGEANTRLPFVVEALAAAGMAGLGARRGRLLLEQVIQHLPTRADALPIGGQECLLAAAPPEPPPTPPIPPLVRVDLVSPYKASGTGAQPRGMDLGLFLMAVVRRISLLQYFYTGCRLEAPFPDLKAASQQVRVVGHDLHRVPASRWAAGHGRRLDIGGLLGLIELATQDLEPLWPYLHLGQWLNVGKNASMGFGQYRLA